MLASAIPRSPGRQVEIEDVASAAQPRHPLLDDGQAVIGGGGEALIEIGAYAEILPQRFAQVLLVAPRPGERFVQLRLRRKARADALYLAVNGVGGRLGGRVAIDLGEHELAVDQF